MNFKKEYFIPGTLFLFLLFCQSSYVWSQGIKYTGLIEGYYLQRKNRNINYSSERNTYVQSYRLGFKGYIIDPKFFVYFAGITFTETKTYYKYFKSTERNIGYYDISFRLLPEKKNSFRFFFKRNKIQTIFNKYDEFNGYSSREGVRWQFVGKRYPTMSLTIQRFRLKALKNDMTNYLTEFNLIQQHGGLSHIRIDYKGNLEINNLTGVRRNYADLRFEGQSKIGKNSKLLNQSSYYSRDFLQIYRSNSRLDINYGGKNYGQVIFTFLGRNSYGSQLRMNRLRARIRRELLERLIFQSNLSIQNQLRNSNSAMARQNSGNISSGIIYQKYWNPSGIKIGTNFDSNLNYQVMSSRKGEVFFLNGARFEVQTGNMKKIHLAGGTSFNSRFTNRSNRHSYAFSYNGDLFVGFIPKLRFKSRFNQKFSNDDKSRQDVVYNGQHIPALYSQSNLSSNSKYFIISKWDNELRFNLVSSFYLSAGYEINDRRGKIRTTWKLVRAHFNYTPFQNLNIRVSFHQSTYLQFKQKNWWLESRMEYRYRRLTFSLEYTDRLTSGFLDNRSKTLKLWIKRPIGEKSPWGEEYDSRRKH